MKASFILLTGLIIGLIAGIFLYPAYSGDSQSQQDASISQITEPCDCEGKIDMLSSKARGITLNNAWKMFDNYHGLSTGSSRACLTTTVKNGETPEQKNIESIFLEYNGFLEVIKCRVENEDETFLGLAGIPVYNSHPDTLSHTLIWVPVVEGANNTRRYFIPQQNTTDFIFEYVGICPDFCPENRCDIWKRDWDVNAQCTVNF